MTLALQRRHVLAASAALGLFATQPAAAARQRLRLGLIGVGARGQVLLRELARRGDVDIVALCDVEPTRLDRALAMLDKPGRAKPAVFGQTGDPRAYRHLLAQRDLDGVLIATPRAWHASMAIDAMQAGVAVGCELAAGLTLQDHWDVLNTQLRTGTPYMLLDNLCYRRDVMALLQMVRSGLFGALIHLQGGGQHAPCCVQPGAPLRRGDVHLSHGIGPIAMAANIQRGNRFSHINAFASQAQGNCKLGGLVSITLACEDGTTIVLQHDTALPRPDALGFRVQGSQGLWLDISKSVHIDGLSPAHRWDGAQPYLDRFDHPLWQRHAADVGRAGMDFFVINAFVQALKANAPMPIDIFDAVAWSAITPLCHQSAAEGFKTLPFPDFTAGLWKTRRPIVAVDDGA